MNVIENDRILLDLYVILKIPKNLNFHRTNKHHC